MKKLITPLFIILLFIVSRVYIYQNPPPYYSDVKADYERYANMWRYGTPPYLKHLYEYPPATIPLLALPLTFDQMGYGKYYSNYRTGVLIIDVLFFAYLLFITTKIPLLKKHSTQSLLAYILMTTLAKDFFYEGIDLAFSSTAFIAFTLTYFVTQEKKAVKQWGVEILTWTFFWLSFAIKFLTLPLMVPLFLLLHRGKLPQQIAAVCIGFALVWGIPIAKYRSSLQVMFVHNNGRPIKYAAFPAHIIRWINSFTHSEEQHMVAPDFEYVGPVSDQVTRVDALVFPLAILSSMGVVGFLIVQNFGKIFPVSQKSITQLLLKPKALSSTKVLELMLWSQFIYVFVLFLTAKIFSQPFHIWYMAPIAFIPVKNKTKWYTMVALASLMIILDMTTWLHIKNNFLIGRTIEIGLIRDAFRFIPMFVMLYFGITEFRAIVVSKEDKHGH